MHWALHHRVIGEAQIGFLPRHGCEWHVLTFMESVRQSWRHKLDAYALFLDLKKAYDRVHPPALWAVLRRMGVPGTLVHLLADRSRRRTTTMEVL